MRRRDAAAAPEVDRPSGGAQRERGEDPVDGVADVQEVPGSVGDQDDLSSVEEGLQRVLRKAARGRPGGEDVEQPEDDVRDVGAAEPRLLDHPLEQDGVAPGVDRLFLEGGLSRGRRGSVERPVGEVDEEGLLVAPHRLEHRDDARPSRREERRVHDGGGLQVAEDVAGGAGKGEVGGDERRLRKRAERLGARLANRAPVSLVSHRVDDDDLGPLREKLPGDGRPDEAGAPGHEDAERHGYSLGSGVGAGPRASGGVASAFAFSAS